MQRQCSVCVHRAVLEQAVVLGVALLAVRLVPNTPSRSKRTFRNLYEYARVGAHSFHV